MKDEAKITLAVSATAYRRQVEAGSSPFGTEAFEDAVVQVDEEAQQVF
ncbi:MAG: hypothetical protein ACU83P_09635 [Gammaproteobacteria bacterium]